MSYVERRRVAGRRAAATRAVISRAAPPVEPDSTSSRTAASAARCVAHNTRFRAAVHDMNA
jgi:hypothetical protein